MYWRVSVVILCLMVSQAIGDNGEYVYVISKKIECISNPVNDICPVTHKVPDRIQNLPWINRTMINTTLSSTSTLLRTAGGNESCIDTNKMFQCSQILYTCKDNDDYVYLDSNRIYQLCNDARGKCMNIDQGLQDRLFNCTLYTTSTRYSKGSKCKEYQKVENDTCPMPDYKVPSHVNFTVVVNFHQTVQSLLKQDNVGKNCADDTLKAVCYIGHPACTRDEKYTVSLLGKKRCQEMINCLNSTTVLGIEAMRLCNSLPDEDTAKNFSIQAIKEPMATPSTTKMSSTTLVVSTTPTPTPTPTPTTTCRASTLSATGHILMLFIVWIIMNSFK